VTRRSLMKRDRSRKSDIRTHLTGGSRGRRRRSTGATRSTTRWWRTRRRRATWWWTTRTLGEGHLKGYHLNISYKLERNQIQLTAKVLQSSTISRPMKYFRFRCILSNVQILTVVHLSFASRFYSSPIRSTKRVKLSLRNTAIHSQLIRIEFLAMV